MRGCQVVINQLQQVPNSYYGPANNTGPWASSNPLTWPNQSPWLCIQFDPTAVIYDTDNILDLVTADRMVIPAALNGMWAKIKISVRWQSNHPTAKFVQILPTRWLAASNSYNLSGYAACSPSNQPYIKTTTTDMSSETHPVQLNTGDVFRAEAWQQGGSGSDGSCPIQAGTFSLEVLGS